MVKLFVAGAALAFGGALAGQTARKIDFGKDVQPIFQASCVSCHGPSQQMAGFRIDQRRYALPNRVGANGARIVPGEIGRSRVYQKIAGSGGGLQMPPTGALSAEQIGIIKTWIEQGAEWPDEVAGETARPPADPGATRLMEAIRNGYRQGFDKLLRADPMAADRRGPGGSTPLMYAALYGDAASLRRLLESGAHPNLANEAGATALMWGVDDADKTRLLLEHGADGNARSGEGRTALMMAAARYGSSEVVKLLLDHGADPSAMTPQGQSASAAAALAGDAGVLRMLAERGADVRSRAGALVSATQGGCIPCFDLLLDVADANALNRAMALSGAQGNAAALSRLLDRSAEVNAKGISAGVFSALMMGAGSEGGSPEVIQTLIDHGADLRARNASGETALDLAKRQGNTPTVDLLKKAGAEESNAPPKTPAKPQPAPSVRAAIERSLPPLQRTDVAFFQKSGCVSCHNNSLTTMALAAARKNRIPVDEGVAQGQMRTIGAYIENWRERVLQGVPIPGGQDTISYILAGLAAGNYPADAATDALARYLKNSQGADGGWRIAASGGSRPPIESSNIEVTALSMRALQLYAPAIQRAAYQKSIRLASGWLLRAQARSTEDRVYQLLGLHWAGGTKEILRKAVRPLLSEQRASGGWAQLATLSPDAYATGQALVALRECGIVAVTDRAYQRGVKFLLDSQLADGSWHVTSRAIPVQPFFDSDFPHGHDQFISAAATNWAVMALAPAAR